MLKRTCIFFCLICFASFLWSDEGFGDIFGEMDFPVDFSGIVGMEFDFYVDDGADSEMAADPFADISLEAGSDSIEAVASFSVSAADLQTPLSAEDLIDELYVKAFFSFGYLEGGYMKTEWGKGDGDHVIDPLNPLDQRNGLYLDLNRMKSSEIMAKINIYLGTLGLLELVYKPHYTPLAVSTEGRWLVFDMSTLPGAESIIVPDTDTLEYSQAAARATLSFGPLDLGVMYYYGFMTEPGYQITTTFTGTNPLDPTHYTTTTDIVYTKAHLFGAEAGWVLGPLTMRAELGFWLTEDSEGDQPELYNNRFVYLTGLDGTIPGINLFLSAQLKGAFVLNYSDLIDTDVDKMASYNDSSLSNTVIGTAELPLFRDRVKLRISGLYQVESKGYMIAPSCFWNIKDDLELSLYGKVFGGEEGGGSPYHSWDDNDSVSLSLKYYF